jgi:hypothetical protein
MSTLLLPRLVVVASLAVSLAARVAAQSPIVPDGSAVGLTRFELQRGLLEIDEQRRRLEASLEPVDSVLRVLAHDTSRIVALTRPTSVDVEVARIAALMRELRVAPDSLNLAARFVDAVNVATQDFTAAESSLGGRLLTGAAAQDYLVRSPRSAIVPLDADLPPRDTPLWEKIRQSDYGKRPLARIMVSDIASYRAAVSDSGFETYRAALLGAFVKRMADIRQTRDSTLAEVQRLRRKAADLAHAIGTDEDSAGRAQAHAINVGLPVFAVVFITLLLAPRIYRSPELQQWIFTSGILLEITTLVLIVAGTLVLALAGKVGEAVIGTVLGGVLGYGVGRGASRRIEIPVATSVPVPARRTLSS